MGAEKRKKNRKEKQQETWRSPSKWTPELDLHQLHQLHQLGRCCLSERRGEVHEAVEGRGWQLQEAEREVYQAQCRGRQKGNGKKKQARKTRRKSRKGGNRRQNKGKGKTAARKTRRKSRKGGNKRNNKGRRTEKKRKTGDEEVAVKVDARTLPPPTPPAPLAREV